MHRIKTATAAVSLALGAVAGMAPAASATTCEALLGSQTCARIREAETFAEETVASLGPIVDEQRDRAAVLAAFAYNTAKGTADQVVAQVLCIVDGSCL
jgi:hypothetical protein